MSEAGQLSLPILSGPALVVGPVFICFEMDGEPHHKARLRFKVIVPKEKWRAPFATGYPDPATVAYEQALRWVAAAAMKSMTPTEQPLALLVHVFKSIPASWSKKDRAAALAGGILPTGKPDWDNYGKITDALNGIAWKDDSQVCDGRVIKRYSDEPGLRVEIREFVAA